MRATGQPDHRGRAYERVIVSLECWGAARHGVRLQMQHNAMLTLQASSHWGFSTAVSTVNEYLLAGD